MRDQLKNIVIAVVCAVWCHRVVYGAIAAAYGAACVGWIEKDLLQRVLTALYVLLVAQSDAHDDRH
ncbi:MAG: hypothetical protein AAF307_03360 [Pseudomonadota bacterium]